MDGAIIISGEKNSQLIERLSAMADHEFQTVKQRALITYNLLKQSERCAKPELFEPFKQKIVQMKTLMEAKFNECQEIHKTSGNHEFPSESERFIFNQKFIMASILSCVTSSRKYAMKLLKEIETVCK